MTRNPNIPFSRGRRAAADSQRSSVCLALVAAWCLFAEIPLVAQAVIGSGQFSEVMVGGRPAIDSQGETWGASWEDYDGDRYPDLWLNKHQYTPAGLYQNNGNGVFSNVIGSAVINSAAHDPDDTHGAAWADFDNDGDEDLIEVCGAGAGSGATAPVINNEWRNNLWVNDQGVLSEHAQAYGIDYPRARSRMLRSLIFTARSRP